MRLYANLRADWMCPSPKKETAKACKNRMDLRISAGCSWGILTFQLLRLAAWGDIYGSPDRWSTGFYCLSSDAYKWGPTVYHTVNVKYDLEGEWCLAEIYHISKDYSVDEFLSKYN